MYQMFKSNSEFVSLKSEIEKFFSSPILKQIKIESAIKSHTLMEVKIKITKNAELGKESTTNLVWTKYQRMLQIV